MTKYKSEFLNTLNQRGFIHQCSDLDALDAKLCEGVQSAYIGFDATAQSLHVGNLTGIMMLYWFQQAGHKPITLMGGGTSKVGDPAFKDKQRSLLTDDVIEENMRHIQATCFKQFLRYGDGETDALMVNNDDWLSDIKYLEFLRDYGRYFTINRMVGFEWVKSRLEKEQTLSLLEFNYMVMQGYDFVELRKRYGTVLQMGGSDQWGNIINGVELWRKMHSGLGTIAAALSDSTLLEPIFGLTAPLLTTPDGKKMGKTENGAVWLNADMLSPYDYWQYWRNVDDAMVGTLLRRFTTLPIAEIEKLEALQGQEINEAKIILANEATKLCHGESEASAAAETAQKVFEQGSVGAELPTIDILRSHFEDGIALIDLLVQAKLTASKGEARRLIQGGGARINDEVIKDVSYVCTVNDMNHDNQCKLSAGKKKHVIVTAL